MSGYCKFCGSKNVKVIGGNNGDPFDRRPERTVCAECGRTLSKEEDLYAAMLKHALEQDNDEGNKEENDEA